MDVPELHERIRRGEDLHTDFKERLSSVDELAKDIVCFANTDGGQILVGVADDGRIAGVTDADALARQVDNAAYNNCEPQVTVVQEVLDADGRRVLVIHVPKGSHRPYRTNKGRYYVRTTSGCRDASREELLRLFQAVESLYFDETPVVRCTLTDLDLGAFEAYLRDAGLGELGMEPPTLLRNWALLSGDHPTVAGLLLFGREPQRALPHTHIAAARFPGTDTADSPIDRTDLTGRLLEVIASSRRWLSVHLQTRHEIRGFEPERKPEIPEEALREAVVNAVAHRDYTVQAPVRLFVLEDRVEIHSPGRAPNTVTAEAMRAGVHVVRNPRLYARLSDAGLVTRAGTGVRRIAKLVREATGQDIGLEVRDYEVLLVLPRPRKPPAPGS